MTPRRILVRGVNWLGDAVMTTPALLRLREAHPRASITLLTPRKLADLWPNHPAVDAVLSFEPAEGPFTIGRRVRAGAFDLGLVLPNSFRSALELWWGAVPERVGYGGQLRAWLVNRPVHPRPEAVRMRKRTKREILRLIQKQEPGPRRPGAPSPDRAHHIYQYLHLVAHLGGNPAALAPQLFITEAEVKALLDRLKLRAVPERPLFALNPGAEYGPAKRWPLEKFVAAARQIQQASRCQWLILGGPRDADAAKQIVQGIAGGSGQTRAAENLVTNLAGMTSLRELCAILKVCRVLLTNDSGPMHVAAALGARVVVPFGSTSPELTGPGLPHDPRHQAIRSGAPCAPCFLRQCPIDLRCLRDIQVEDVVAAVLTS